MNAAAISRRLQVATDAFPITPVKGVPYLISELQA
jgi:hypothetical protein